jgi:hypothetical protein
MWLRPLIYFWAEFAEFSEFSGVLNSLCFTWVFGVVVLGDWCHSLYFSKILRMQLGGEFALLGLFGCCIWEHNLSPDCPFLNKIGCC